MTEILIGFTLGFALGIGLTVTIKDTDWHDRYCITQFYHAKTSADSLLIVQDDKYCAKIIEKIKK